MALSESEKIVTKVEENEDSGVFDVNSPSDLTMSSTSSRSRSRIPDEVRMRINDRERQRMHELNDALEALRRVLPHSTGSAMKKLSKLSTLIYARDHILSLTRSIEDMKSVVQSLSRKDPRGESFGYEEWSGSRHRNHSCAFVPGAPRYSPYTSTPIKSHLGEFSLPTPPQSHDSPVLLKLQDNPTNRNIENNIRGNVNASRDFWGYPQFRAAPLDSTRTDAPEFFTPTKYQNSSPARPVLKFSVESLLGLSSSKGAKQTTDSNTE